MTMTRARWTLLLTIVWPLLGGCSDEATEDAVGPESWGEQTFRMQISAASWTQPPGWGAEIGDFVPQFVFSTGALTADSLEVTIGTTNAAGAQQPCNPTATVAATTSSFPSSQLGPIDFPLYLKHIREDVAVLGTVRGMTLTNVLPGGAAKMGELTGILDFREIYPMFTVLVPPTPEGACTALTDTDVTCEACPHDGEPFCVSIKAVRLDAIAGTPMTLAPVALEGIDATACGLDDLQP